MTYKVFHLRTAPDDNLTGVVERMEPRIRGRALRMEFSVGRFGFSTKAPGEEVRQAWATRLGEGDDGVDQSRFPCRK